LFSIKKSAAKAFFNAIPSNDKTFITYERSFHDILNDVEKEKAFEDIYRFIVQKSQKR